jgi:D,D-heptose 1,7-bisphosphate phosphatase
MKRALFLDRDGPVVVDAGYTRDPSLVALTKGAAEGLRAARALGYALVLVSNQSGIGRGLITNEEARAVHQRMEELLAAEGITLDATYYCPHAPDAGCKCRKPLPGMLLDASKERGFDLADSVMLGDKVADVECGLAAGCRAIRFAGPVTPSERVASAADWPGVVERLEAWSGRKSC